MAGVTYTAPVEASYQRNWNAARLRAERRELVLGIAGRLANKRARYEAAARSVGCPWWWVSAVHQLESSQNFTRHLHNGDPLTARTRQVPAGRPAVGNPPFTWEESALDALRLKRLQEVKAWPLSRCLYEWERYNGWGYLGRVNSPYLWSFTTLYERGKYVADHVYDPKAVSQQCGAAAILMGLVAIGAVMLPGEAAVPVLVTVELTPPALPDVPLPVKGRENFIIDIGKAIWRLLT